MKKQFFFYALLCFIFLINAQQQPSNLPPDFSYLDTSGIPQEKYEFETQVNRLMKLIINSLYKSKDVFLRELISNASDALDKIKFLSLTKKQSLGDNQKLNITIVINKQQKTLVITDYGVGMTKKDLKDNLGTIAKSGTSEFLSAFEKGNVSDVTGLIGQFGVGFYSVFLVADSVTVVTKNNNDENQYIWESTAASDFTIKVDPRGPTLIRGTQIIIKIKDDSLEYLLPEKIKSLIETHSQFIAFPIYIWDTKTISEQVPDDDVSPVAENNPDSSDSSDSTDSPDSPVEDVTNDSPTKESTPKMKTIQKFESGWELLNKEKPVWIRRPTEVSETEYNAFYHAFSKGTEDPLAYSHFRAEGDVEFHALLFIEKKRAAEIFSREKVVKNIKMFVRRVFITDEITDMLPSYLRFITGIVDSEDFPLNVSRENLQNNSLLKTVKKKLLAKALDMIKALMEDEKRYNEFFEHLGASLKLGLVEDAKNAPKLLNFLKYKSSKSNGKLITIDEYVKNMKEGQDQIYYAIGDSVEAIEGTPVVENLSSKGYEILYMTEAIDDYVVRTAAFTTIDGKKSQNVAQSGVKIAGEEEELKEAEVKFKPLIEKMKTVLSKHVDVVRVSTQLVSSPCAVIASGQGLSPSMEKLMKAQASQQKNDHMLNYYLSQKLIVEINPKNEIIIKMLEKVENGDMEVDDMIHILFEAMAVDSGYTLRNPKSFSSKIQNVIRSLLEAKGVDGEKKEKNAVEHDEI